MVASRKVDLLAIVGPTASGKSELAMKIATSFNGEIIAADSRTIYRDMDIGTAKPGQEERALVPHWGLDLINPGERYSAAKFKKYALAKINKIQSEGKLPILVGGTGLYVDAVLMDFNFPKSINNKNLENLTIDQLQAEIINRNYSMPENKLNRRHLINTLKRQGQTGTQSKGLMAGSIIIGLAPNAEELKNRISDRAEAIFSKALLQETKYLIKKYGENAVQLTGGLVYKICIRYLKGEIDEESALELFKIADWQYARRQRTWLKRNKFIQWYSSSDAAFTAVSKLLNKQSRISHP